MRPTSRTAARVNGWAGPAGGAGSEGRGSSGSRRASPLCIVLAVQVVLFVLVTLAAFTMFTTSRIERAETVKELARLREDKARLEGALDALRHGDALAAPGAVTAHSRVAPGQHMEEAAMHAAMHGKCASLLMGWWSYEVCPFLSARQFHERDSRGAAESYSLGVRKDEVGSGRTVRPTRGPMTHLLHGGSPCENGHARETEVELVCGVDSTLALIWISEERPCQYHARVASKEACLPGEVATLLPPVDTSVRGGAQWADTAVVARVKGGTAPGPAPAPSQYANLPAGGSEAAAEKAAAVVEAFRHSWGGYKEFAWGKDEFQPIGRKAKPDWIGLGLTIVDALSTMWLMEMTEEFDAAVVWIEENLSTAHALPKAVSFFETTIRCLGGLLSAHELSGKPVLLAKALDVGEALSRAFATPSGLPFAQINLHTGAGSVATWTKGNLLLAEVGTVQMEFFKLAQLTGRADFYDKAHAVFTMLDAKHPRAPPLGTTNGGRLWPLYVSPRDGALVGTSVSWGAMGDSYYEYLLKTYLLVGRKSPAYIKMYRDSIQGMRDSLVTTSPADGRVYVAEMKDGKIVAKMDHLACFLPGLLALGSTLLREEDSTTADTDLELAKELASTCWAMYSMQASGVAPEFVKFDASKGMHNGQHHNLLRPETAESLFILWRVTKDPLYREQAWAMFLAFDRWCRVQSGGFAGLKDVTSTNPAKDDTMQSFWLAETLKYLF